MEDRLKLSDTALADCVASCMEASTVLAGPARATTPPLNGVTDLGSRVDEFVSALAAACRVLAAAADGIGESAEACVQGSDLVEAGAIAAVTEVGGAGR